MKDRKRRNIMIGSLCALLVFMGIGYAIISQMLTIRGVSTVAGDWNIYIDSITPNAVGTGVSVSESVGLDKVSASFEANLYAPGDKVEYKVVVKNDGNIDAKLGAVNQKVSNDTDGIVKYSNTLENGYILRHGESYVFYVTTELPEELEELPENTVRAVLDLKLNFTQYTGGGDLPSGNTIQILSGDINTVGSEIVIGTEHFYVVPNMEGDGDDKVSLFAKYNLLVGNNYIDDDSGEFTLVSTHTDDEIGYNKQSSEALGYYFNKYTIYNDDDDSIYTTWNKGEVPLKDGVPVDFSQLDFEYHIDCDLSYGEGASATVPFANIVLNTDGKGYWYDNQSASYLEKYNVKGNQLMRYVYDRDNSYNTISEYVETYKNILETEYSLQIEKANLLSFEQAIDILDCDVNNSEISSVNNNKCNLNNVWAWNTTYWLGSARTYHFVWVMYNDGTINRDRFTVEDYGGVRPVIVLDKSLFN